MPAEIYIGTSGYYYRDWKGIFYPEKLPETKFLEFYSRYFNIIELNTTFYNIPDHHAALKMVKYCLKFTIKVPEIFSHQKLLEEKLLKKFISYTKVFLEHKKFEGLLLQFPYSFKYTEENLAFLKSLLSILNLKTFVEFRHHSWKNFEFKNFKIFKVFPDIPYFKEVIKENLNSQENDEIYLRLSGRNEEKWFEHNKAEERYFYRYSDDFLKQLAHKIINLNAKKVFVLFNNHPQGNAPLNALKLLSFLGMKKNFSIQQKLF